jgi:hypothetical protein
VNFLNLENPFTNTESHNIFQNTKRYTVNSCVFISICNLVYFAGSNRTFLTSTVVFLYNEEEGMAKKNEAALK